jgi:hypothetical protein
MEIFWLALKIVGVYLGIIVLGGIVITILAYKYNWNKSKIVAVGVVAKYVIRLILKWLIIILIICIIIKYLTN